MNSKILVVIPTYLERSSKYLEMCLESLSHQTLAPDHVVVASQLEFKPQPDLSFVSINHANYRRHYAQSVNEAIHSTNIDSFDYILILSDDAILNKHALKRMVHASQDVFNDNAILNPASNCENGMHYVAHFSVDDSPLLNIQKGTFDHIYPIKDKIIQENINGLCNVFVNTLFCAFYCTLIPMKIFKATGNLDEKFMSGKEDLDYCLRAKQQGFGCMIDLGVYCYHFSGTTEDHIIEIDQERMKEKQQNEIYFQEKWS